VFLCAHFVVFVVKSHLNNKLKGIYIVLGIIFVSDYPDKSLSYYEQLIPKIMNSRIILTTFISIILLGLSPGAVWSGNSVTLNPGSSAKAPQDSLQTKANINTSRSNIKHSTPRSAETGVNPGSPAGAPQNALQTKANINTSRSNTKGIASGPAETGINPGSPAKAPQDTLQTKANIKTSEKLSTPAKTVRK
jgi:hypothetical protein